MNINEQLNERRSIIAQQREMNDKAVAEKRAFTKEEQEKYDRMEADANLIKANVDREKSLQKVEKDIETPQTDPIRAALDEQYGSMGKSSKLAKMPKDYQARATTAYAEDYFEFVANKQIKATLQKAVSTQGGFLVPIEYEKEIRLKQYDDNLMRQIANVITTSSQVDIPMEGNLPTFTWISELGTYNATDLTVGQVILGANKLGGVVTASEELLQDAFTDIPAYIASRASLSAAFAEEVAFFNGDGNTKPTGILTTLATSGTTVTSASNATYSSTDMYAMQYALPRPYRKRASYVVADTVISKLRQEKATTGQYLWAPSLTADAPDIYLNKPIYTSDFIPVAAPGSVSAIFGDFSYYQIVDRVGWSMQQLNELFALQGSVGWKMWERTDGKVLRPEAFVSLTTHA